MNIKLNTIMKTKWTIDEAHSEVHFKVKHLVISTVTGAFAKYSAVVETDDDNFETAKVHFSAVVNSITTGNEQRDGHLMSADFFDSANYPTLDFVGDKMEKTGDGTYVLHGSLTMRGTTQPLALKVEYGGMMKDFYGNVKAGFEVSGTIKRKEFGLHWDAVTEAGGIVVSDDIKIVANVQFTKAV